MKKLAVKVLLPLLFSFCCVFSGFLSVDAFAYTSYDNFPCTVSLDFNYERGTATANADYDVSPNANNVYVANNSKLTGVTAFSFASHTGESFYFPVDQNVFNYYLFGSFVGVTDDISNFTYFPDSFFTRTRNHSNGLIPLEISDLSFYHTDSYHCKGFSFSCLVDMSSYNCIDYFIFKSSTAGTLPAKLNFEFSVIALPKTLSSDDAQMAIVSAINNQTNQLSSDIGQAADDIQQSIEDQYSGDPETEFSVDDVITQHNEKMGVLSFGSDVMLQFLDMFQSANVGTAQLTLPGFNITVENVEYSVWPDYSFNFEQLNEWVPALMSVIRVMLPAFVWLMVLRYCINVFEKNFLSNGG